MRVSPDKTAWFAQGPCHIIVKLPQFHRPPSATTSRGKSVSKRSEELRRRARELTGVKSEHEPSELVLDLAQACIALARNEEWLDGEISPVEGAADSAAIGE
jgi:hypothetical protein